MQNKSIIFRKLLPIRIFEFYKGFKNDLLNKKHLNNWKEKGCPVPPPHIVKQKTIIKYAKDYNLKTFVETGTYFGDMISALKNNFNSLYSIELSFDLYQLADKRFKKYKQINIIEGDSGEKLKEIVPYLKEPSLFWLDGHYSGGLTAKGKNISPIIDEIKIILSIESEGNIILIDDARLFTGKNGYPELEMVVKYVKKLNSNTNIKIENDIICITLDLKIKR